MEVVCTKQKAYCMDRTCGALDCTTCHPENKDTIVCENCGSEISPFFDGEYCPDCGTEL